NFCFFFFFFQAEDGIRDLIVTGVQTCALPISAAPAFGGRGSVRDHPAARRRAHRGLRVRRARGARRQAADAAALAPHSAGHHARSEERRVGKECRSRWAPYDSKKKTTQTAAKS